MNRALVVIAVAAALVGCSSIEQPIASLPLVDSQHFASTEEAPSGLANQLDKTRAGLQIVVDGNLYYVSSLFYAARGNYCRFLTNNDAKLVYCKSDNEGWFKVPSILSELQISQREALE
jgi:uncharacterized protein YceK